MNQHARVIASVAALRDITVEQRRSLDNAILADGHWDTIDHASMWIDPMGATLMVSLKDAADETVMLVGIELDGYTHS